MLRFSVCMVTSVSGFTCSATFFCLQADNNKAALPATRNATPYLEILYRKVISQHEAPRPYRAPGFGYRTLLFDHLDGGAPRNPAALHVVGRSRSSQSAE